MAFEPFLLRRQTPGSSAVCRLSCLVSTGGGKTKTDRTGGGARPSHSRGAFLYYAGAAQSACFPELLNVKPTAPVLSRGRPNCSLAGLHRRRRLPARVATVAGQRGMGVASSSSSPSADTKDRFYCPAICSVRVTCSAFP